jgi:hypothetical protein
VNNSASEPATPRGLSRIQGVVEDPVRRIPPEAWPFVLLAVFWLAANSQAVLSLGSSGFMLTAAVAAGAMLPAAILIGCPDAWRSARLVLVGAIVWTTIPFVVRVISSGQQWFSPEEFTTAGLRSNLEIARSAADILSLAGPAVVALGLLQRRRTQTTWPRALVALALIGTVLLCVYETNNATRVFSETPEGLTGGNLWSVVNMALGPLGLLTVGALAWSTLAAVRAREESRRFWLWVFAGSAVLLGVGLLSVALTLVLGSLAVDSDTYVTLLEQTIWIDGVGSLVGMAFLLVGFALGLPATARVVGEDEVALPSPTS